MLERMDFSFALDKIAFTGKAEVMYFEELVTAIEPPLRPFRCADHNGDVEISPALP
jgi:hypothetical protein